MSTGHDAVLQRAQAQAVAELLDRELLALEELHGQLVVELGDGLDHGGAVGVRLGAQLGGDVRDLDLLAEVVAVEDGLAFDEVDDALEAGLPADGDLDRHGIGAEALADGGHPAPEVGARAVELVDEAEARHAVAVGLPPDRLGLGLHTGDAVEDDDRAIEHPEAALHLDGEVHVSGRIDDVDAMVLPDSRSWPRP